VFYVPRLRPHGTPSVPNFGVLQPPCVMQYKRGRSPRLMDTILVISFGSVLCAMTALSFMELRRIRKKLGSSPVAQPPSR
jgi:hypothetical protein